MMTIHQIWLGGELPERMRPWVESMRQLAAAAGGSHHLWTEDELQARYAEHEALRVFERARGVIPDCTLYGLAGDWYRYALCADFGGMYADTDMQAQDVPALLAYELPADVTFSNEGVSGNLACCGLIWCRGERGHAAAKVLFQACTRRLLSILPPDADDFATRAVRIARQDECVSGIARFGIGPVPLRDCFMPAARKAGFTVAPLPRPVESDRRHLAGAWIVHNSAAAWYDRQADWCGMARRALEIDACTRHERTVAALPPHLRPQGAAELPQVTRKATAEVRQTPSQVSAEVRAMLRVPTDARRIVIFSNVTAGFSVQDAGLRRGDFCVHINRARHLADALKVPGTRHALIVRHGQCEGNQIVWFTPSSFDGLQQVIFLSSGNPIEGMPWWREYRAATSGKVPTTGHIAARLMRELAPSTPLVLAGFDPARRHGTPQWHGHAWHYEAAHYAAQDFNLITPH